MWKELKCQQFFQSCEKKKNVCGLKAIQHLQIYDRCIIGLKNSTIVVIMATIAVIIATIAVIMATKMEKIHENVRRPQQKKSMMHSPIFADPPKQPTNCITKCHNYKKLHHK